MTRTSGATGIRQLSRFLVLPLVAAMVLTLLVPYTAQAVHDTGAFQLDGNAQTSVQPSPPAPQNAEDWDMVCPTASPPSRPSTDPVHCLGGSTANPQSFDADAFGSATDDVFTGGGSKDDLDIPGNWKWQQAAPSPDKDDLEHGFAAEYNITTGTYAGHKVLYFGGDRFSNEGDANIAFWFFQSAVGEIGNGPNNSCTLASGCPFSGAHTAGNKSLGGSTPGDILIVSAFTIGGSQPTIRVYEWVGAGNATSPCFTNTCTLQPVPIPIPAGQTDNRCDQTGVITGDVACALVNDTLIPSPWLFQDKAKSSPANQIQLSEFYEGGLDLTQIGFAGACFRSFLLNTRSSQSGNATLKDFVLGQFGRCESTVETTPKDGNGNPITGPLSIGTGSVSVKDSATVTITGTTTWSGTLSFFLCGPIATGTCTTGGTQIGSTQTISNTTTQPILSDAATVTSVGRYCWRADFVHITNGVPDGSDSRASECFTVNPVTPTLTTQASGPVQLGNAISDTATITGTANQPGTPVINPTTAGSPAGGMITFTAFGPNNCTTVAFGPTSVTITGDGTYGPVSFTPTAVGTYTFVASYSGNSPNTNPVAATGCPDTTGTETVLVTDTTSVVTAQDWLPNDSATITSAGGSALNGSVVFTLYHSADCTGTALYTEPSQAISGTSPQSKITHNTSVKVSVSDTVSWKAVYTSNDSNVAGSSSNCEKTVLQITN
ncbi:MAG: hypothetical protein E6H91_07925 [Chloroflexi bacterium]|nr:MAG: hypothetical protein E6H91_07925 [Chloroflexota bacterium]